MTLAFIGRLGSEMLADAREINRGMRDLRVDARQMLAEMRDFDGVSKSYAAAARFPFEAYEVPAIAIEYAEVVHRLRARVDADEVTC